MPKPLLLARPSGLYVRFLVPADLRAAVGTRFLVRPLHLPAGDVARLVAAHLGLALSQAFDALREGRPVDIDEILRRARSGGRIQDLVLKGVELPNGVRIAGAEINTPDDEAMMLRMLGSMAEVGPLQAVEPARPKRKRNKLLGAAIVDHLADLERANLAPKTVMETRHTLRILEELVGSGVNVADITEAHMREFFEVVSWWPAHASKREPYRGKPAREVVKLAKANGEPQPAAYTQRKHRQRLAVFFRSLIKGKFMDDNPMEGIYPVSAPEEEDKGEPFTADELGRIFGPNFKPWAAEYPHRWFGVALGLYSGARVAEIGQLRVEDIQQERGVHGFMVRSAAPGQRVKNKSSRRFLPFAQPVLDAGILDYLEDVKTAGHVRLFPHLPNSTGLGFGRALSKQFSTYIKRQGITTKGQGFHGFRHTIASELDRAGVSEAAIAAITGHSRKGGSVLVKHYIDRSTIQDRVATLAKFVPPVALPAYQRGQFAESLAKAPIKLVQSAPKESAAEQGGE